MSRPTALLTSRKFATTPSLGKIHSASRNYLTGVPDFLQLTIPAGVDVTMNRPSFVGIGKRTYVMGMFSRILVRPEDGLLYVSGLHTPPPPGSGSWSMTAGAGPTNQVGYLAYRQRLQTSQGNLILAESSISRGTPLVVGNTTRTWAALPTTAPDAKTTHLVGFVSVASGAVQEAWEYPIGIPSLVESTTAYGAVGNTLREPAPFLRYGEFFANCLWGAGDPNYPFRVYRSQVGEHEAFDGATGFIDLPDREAIIGMKRAGNTLVVFGPYVAYAITGFGINTSDFTIDKISPSVGCVSHHSIVNINEWLWFMAEEGPCIWDGQQFRYVMEDLRTYFKEDFIANFTAYRNCHAADNKMNKMYELLIPKTSGHFSYAGYYLPMYTGEQSQPDWFFKTRGRYEYALGRLRLAADIPRLYTTDTVGFMRQEDMILGDLNDDTDSALRTCVIQSGHLYGDGVPPAGNERLGKLWNELDSYFRCEIAKDNQWRLQGFGGDESAIESTAPQYDVYVPVSLVAGWVAKERHNHHPEALSGDGISLRWTVTSPGAGVRFKGYRAACIPGSSARLKSS